MADMAFTLLPHYFFSLEAFAHVDLFEDISFVWEALGKLSNYLSQQKLGTIATHIPPLAHLENSSLISIGEGTIIEPGVYIQGPCLIGKNCVLRHGAYIRGGVVTGDGCVIGHDTEIKNAILLDGACAAHFNYVGDSILGNRVNLGAGVKCANLRFDHQSVTVTVQGQKFETRLKKLGAIIGDGSQLGCNCVTNPGALIGKNVFCSPCLNISGYIPDQGRVKPSHFPIVE